MGFGPEGKDKFPFGKIEREQLRQSYSEYSEARVSEERSNDPDDIYIIYDEPLSGYADSNFSLTFSPLLERRGKTLRFFVEESLEKKRGKAVGIEFGGPGSNLFAGFTRGFFVKTLGVALTDMRDLEKKSKDKEKHHSVLEGDITDMRTYEQVEEWLSGVKADFIIERLAGGHVLLPPDPYLLGQVFQRWYSLLSEEGLIVAQAKDWMRPVLMPWSELIKRECRGTLEFDYKHGLGNQTDTFDAVLVRKLQGAPDTLPILDARTVREISKRWPSGV